jgi:predicted nucleic acid-binding protein
LSRVRDTHHDDADRMFQTAVARRVRMLTTNLVVAETHQFVLSRSGIQPAARLLDRIDMSPLVVVEFPRKEHHDAGRRWIAQLADHDISYTDAVSFAVMRSTRCSTVLGFDHHFSIAGFRLWQPSRRASDDS